MAQQLSLKGDFFFATDCTMAESPKETKYEWQKYFHTSHENKVL